MESDESTNNSFKCASISETKLLKKNLIEDNQCSLSFNALNFNNLISKKNNLNSNLEREKSQLDTHNKVLNKVNNTFLVSLSICILNSKSATLGKGTYGIVRNGSIFINNQLDQNECAFKTFLGKDGLYFSQTVLREIIPLCSLPVHENVLKPRIVFIDEKNRIHFASELMKCNLHERLKLSSCTLQQKLEWSYELIQAVHHLHSNGFLHRDIKLENIFLDINGRLILGDLGMSRFSCPFISPQFSSGVCTLWTRAPELCAYSLDNSKNSREAKYTSSVDCFSLAITILSIFASRYFFQGKDEEEMLKVFFTTLGKPLENSKSLFWCEDTNLNNRETRNSKPKWKSIASNITLLSTNTEEVFYSLLLECSKRHITVHPDLIRSLLPLLSMEPETRGSAFDLLQNPFWISMKDSIKPKKYIKQATNFNSSKVCLILDTQKAKNTLKVLKESIKQISDSQILFFHSNYYSTVNVNEITTIQNDEILKDEDPKKMNLLKDEDIYNSCTTKGVLRLAVTEWILSLKKSLCLQSITILDSILFWEKVRDLVDVEVKNEMVLAAACCSLISKVHEYTLYSNQRWIRCLSNSATVEDLSKYELLALKITNCKVFTNFQEHPLTILNKRILETNLVVSESNREKMLHLLCTLISKYHSNDSVKIDEMITRCIESIKN